MNENRLFDLATGEQCRYPFVLPEGGHYDPDATCPRWMQFLKEITCGDAALETYIKRMVGYCMTDSTSEQVMFVLLGDGCNGKSAFINVICQIMGGYVHRAALPLVFSKQGTVQEGCVLADIKDCRLAVLAEPIHCEFLRSSIVKYLVDDGGKVTARQLYGNSFEYVPKFKMMVEATCLPKVDGDDAAVWRRVCIVPFKASFAGEQRDQFLMDKLQHELPGIFNWALEGAEEWCAHGLPKLTGSDHEKS